MKRVRIVQAVLLLAVAAVIASCSSSRRNSYADYPPHQPQFSMIIHSSPGITVRRYHDGRYYYRNPQGYTYWRGYDNRYYLDRSHVRRGHYQHRQYNDWKRSNGKYYRKNHRR